jgi:hypothetical protein
MKWMDAILVVVGWFLKLAKMVLTKTIMTTFDMEKIVIDMWVNNHRMPQFIVNNRDVKFMAEF